MSENTAIETAEASEQPQVTPADVAAAQHEHKEEPAFRTNLRRGLLVSPPRPVTKPLAGCAGARIVGTIGVPHTARAHHERPQRRCA